MGLAATLSHYLLIFIALIYGFLQVRNKFLFALLFGLTCYLSDLSYLSLRKSRWWYYWWHIQLFFLRFFLLLLLLNDRNNFFILYLRLDINFILNLIFITCDLFIIFLNNCWIIHNNILLFFADFFHMMLNG